MKNIRGSIDCIFQQIVPVDCIINVSVYSMSSSNAKGPQCKLLNSFDCSVPKTFPLKYEISYDESMIDNHKYTNFIVVKIFKNKQIIFENGSSDIVAIDGKFRHYLDLYLNPVSTKKN